MTKLSSIATIIAQTHLIASFPVSTHTSDSLGTFPACRALQHVLQTANQGDDACCAIASQSCCVDESPTFAIIRRSPWSCCMMDPGARFWDLRRRNAA